MIKELDYPIRFEPIFKDKIWGGEKLKKVLNKNINGNKVGESWEVSAVENDISVVSNGFLKGLSLKELVTKFKGNFIGNENYQKFRNEFPLLIKFIDASEDLSIQVHPNDELAKKRYNSFGKTEMWYVVDAEENSSLILGFNEDLSKKKYQEVLREGEIEKYLNYEEVKKGDSFFVEGGLIHAIGKGVMIAEIQQTSDVTYRIYDWDRKDSEGNERELHTELSLDALKYSSSRDFKIKKDKDKLIESKYFSVNEFDIKEEKTRDLSEIDSFIIYICVEGNLLLNEEGKSDEALKKGEVVLYPSNYNKVITIKGKGKVLEIYL